MGDASQSEAVSHIPLIVPHPPGLDCLAVYRRHYLKSCEESMDQWGKTFFCHWLMFCIHVSKEYKGDIWYNTLKHTILKQKCRHIDEISLLAVPEVATMTISNGMNGENFVKNTSFWFQWRYVPSASTSLNPRMATRPGPGELGTSLTLGSHLSRLGPFCEGRLSAGPITPPGRIDFFTSRPR